MYCRLVLEADAACAANALHAHALAQSCVQLFHEPSFSASRAFNAEIRRPAV